MQNKQKGALVVGLGLVMLFAGVLVVAQCFDRSAGKETEQNVMQQQPAAIVQNVVKEQTGMLLTVSESVDDWKKCQNLKVGYEVKYPSDWNVYSRGPQGNLPEKCGTEWPEIAISPEDQYNVEKGNFGIFYLNTSPNLGYVYSGSRSLEEFLQKYSYGSGKIQKETLIDGKRAVWMERTVKDGFYTDVLTYNNYAVFVLQQRNMSPESFDQFLSTFKFLK